jgi:acyl-CoA synthetase (AMP-forming)/AMP-acid ligase II
VSTTLGAFLEDVAATFGDSEAVVSQDGRRFTYAQLLGEAKRAAADVERGERRAIVKRNTPEAVFEIFGVALAGGVVIPLSTFATKPELDFMTKDCAAGTVTDDDDAVIIYSSGTTSKPKGMMHSHSAHVHAFRTQADLFGRGPGSRVWSAFPLFWTAGFDTWMGATLAGGGCLVMQETFEPGEALALMARERVTEPYCLPHQTAALAEHADWATTDLSAMKQVYGKSAFARHPKVDGDPHWQNPTGYGMSETCAFFAAHRYDTPRETMKRSIGRLLPGNEVRIAEGGELCVKGPTLMKHYVGKTPEECFDQDGFFHTGDTGHLDAEGNLVFDGRKTEMIKTGGANVSPAEIEVALRAFGPVKLARIVGVPDARLGEIVVGCIVLKDGAVSTEDDVKSFLRERVASYKVPKRVLFFADGEIPMTSSATKVRDEKLIEMAMERL